MKNFILGFIAGFLIAFVWCFYFLNAPKANGVTCLCHVPPGNPSNSQTICVGQGGYNGHFTSPGVLHGQDYWGSCHVASPTPTPRATPSPSPNLCEPAGHHCDHDRDCCSLDCDEGRCHNGASPSPSASPSASPEPSATPESLTCANGAVGIDGHECGWSPPLYKPPEYKPAECSVTLPTPVTPTYKAMGETSVQLTWESDDTNTTHWSVSYGYDKDNLPYGVLDIPKEAREITINGLLPNTVRWFELARWNTNECAVYGNRIDP